MKRRTDSPRLSRRSRTWPFRQQAITLALGSAVKFVGTASLKVEELSAERAVVTVANKKRVQNHIGGVPA